MYVLWITRIRKNRLRVFERYQLISQCRAPLAAIRRALIVSAARSLNLFRQGAMAEPPGAHHTLRESFGEINLHMIRIRHAACGVERYVIMLHGEGVRERLEAIHRPFPSFCSIIPHHGSQTSHESCEKVCRIYYIGKRSHCPHVGDDVTPVSSNTAARNGRAPGTLNTCLLRPPYSPLPWVV